jgi:hypothetical protein
LNEVQYFDGSVWQSAPQFAIEDDAVTTAKIANGAVTSAKIADGSIINIDISPSAEIAKTKISGTAITAADTGTVTSAMIADGTIINDDINASAAIAHSKLANASAGQVLLGTTTSGVITATSLSGDITVNGAGVTAIGSGVIVNADINASAAIADTKLATIATANKVSISSIDIDGGTDIGSAIADADLFIVDDGGAGTNRKSAATRIPTYVFSKISGAITINSSGVATLTNNIVNLDDLTDVNVSVKSVSQVLMWSGSEWNAQTIPLSPPDDDQPILATRIFR